LSIPTIGIGAGKYTDGQVLVINDVLGLFKDFSPKFAKVFADVGAEVKKGINRYINDVKNNVFPEEKHTFKIDKEIIDKLSKDKF
jgi:3-methyl-2-oxobutanoate hydroxymethyltransferase